MTTKKLVLVSPDDEEKSLLAKLLAAALAIVPFRKKKDAVVNEKVSKFLVAKLLLHFHLAKKCVIVLLPYEITCGKSITFKKDV